MTALEAQILEAYAAIKKSGENSWYLWDDFSRKAGTEDAMDILQPIVDEIEEKCRYD